MSGFLCGSGFGAGVVGAVVVDVVVVAVVFGALVVASVVLEVVTGATVVEVVVVVGASVVVVVVVLCFSTGSTVFSGFIGLKDGKVGASVGLGKSCSTAAKNRIYKNRYSYYIQCVYIPYICFFYIFDCWRKCKYKNCSISKYFTHSIG